MAAVPQLEMNTNGRIALVVSGKPCVYKSGRLLVLSRCTTVRAGTKF
jgi:hypothetical protein